jgi:hypothetical protein
MRTHILLVSSILAVAVGIGADAPQNQSAAKQSNPGASKIESHWLDLADPDASKAYRAMLALKQSPKETIAHIAKHLTLAVAPDERRVELWIADLGSDSFATRE